MDPVVETERQPLQLGEEVEPVLVGDFLADPLRLVIGEAGKQAPCGRGDDDQNSDRQKGVAGVIDARLPPALAPTLFDRIGEAGFALMMLISIILALITSPRAEKMMTAVKTYRKR